MSDKTVFIIGGSNGVGKTTFAKEFIKEENIEFLNADEISKKFKSLESGDNRIKSGKEFFFSLEKMINSNQSFVIESTLSGRYLKKVIDSLKSKGFRIVIIYIFIESQEQAIDRVRIRVQEGGHDIPTKDLIRRFYRSPKNFWDLYKEMADEWQLYYNGEDNLIQVGIGESGKQTIINEDKFNLFFEGIKL